MVKKDFILVPMLRVGMQDVALRADIPKAKLAWQISVPNLWIHPILSVSKRLHSCYLRKLSCHSRGNPPVVAPE
ncbi:MAG: hypothetical protein GY749_01895 [Desulfobacteraceae bacterium]|nr:hypothetical protein [Desulfobacteraceae bacterium]